MKEHSIKNFNEFQYKIESLQFGQKSYKLPEPMEILITSDREALDICLEIIHKHDVVRNIETCDAVSCVNITMAPKIKSPKTYMSLICWTAAELMHEQSKNNAPCNIVFTGSFMNDIPSLIERVLDMKVTKETISLAEEAVLKGMNSFILPAHTPKDSLGNMNAASNHSKFYDAIKGFLDTDKLSVAQNMILEDLNVSLGPAAPETSLDFVFMANSENSRIAINTLENVENDDHVNKRLRIKNIALGIAEVANLFTSPCALHERASAKGANIALSHLAQGLESHEIKVPMIYTNGNLYQFAWITLLDGDSVPASHIVSHVLDVTRDRDLSEIAHHLAIIKAHCLTCIDMLSARQNSVKLLKTEIKLNPSKYFFKNVASIFRRFHFEVDSLAYIWMMFSKLKDVPEAIKPLGFTRLSLCDDETGTNNTYTVMVLPRVDSSFLLGIPSDEIVYDKFISNLKSLLKRIHEAGVVHLDLYPSNIFWKYEDDDVMIKIIDWDGATLFGDTFTDSIKESGARRFGETADAKCDAWFVFIFSNLNVDERENMNGLFGNDVYNSAVNRLGQENTDLRGMFENWFVENW